MGTTRTCKRLKWDDALALLRVYIYPIVAIAVIPLLTSGIWRFEKLLKFLAVATSIDTLARAVNFWQSILQVFFLGLISFMGRWGIETVSIE